MVEPIQELIEAAEAELEVVEPRLAEVRFSSMLAKRWNESTGDVCPVCDASLDDDGLERLHAHVLADDAEELAQLEASAMATRRRIAALRKLDGREQRADLRTAETAYRKLTVRLGDAQEDLAEKNEQLLNVEGEALEKLVKRHGDLKLLLENALVTFEREDNEHRDAKVRAESLEEQIRKQNAGQVDPSVIGGRSLHQAWRTCLRRRSSSTAIA